ncbi:hypothetical protein [Jeotgalibacillus campisalis]|uniref:Uncharacterized protein n=1 Tax=Jeotgalibacillus campisalis TaxID=220754 RepID=A0A0C2SFI8_9BACL|nr:hypothetical protein [Jeotgalibacillus campisalis]KIL52684.1 hypothetical protein KR50_00130 [Jeotgalibacillus campisalis]
MAKTLIYYGTLILMIVITFTLYSRMLGAIPLLILSLALYYMAYLEMKKDKYRNSSSD